MQLKNPSVIALEIWFSHPAGLTRAVAVIVDEVDALWRRDPEISYRLVSMTIPASGRRSTFRNV